MPTETVATSSRLYVLAGLIGGFALGLVAAILAARLSSKVLDRYEAETVLNQPMAGELIHAGGLTTVAGGSALRAAVCARTGGQSHLRPGAGERGRRPAARHRRGRHAAQRRQRRRSALAMAGRFARTDLNSVIIDFDSHDPELTELFAVGDRRHPDRAVVPEPAVEQRCTDVVEQSARAASIRPRSSPARRATGCASSAPAPTTTRSRCDAPRSPRILEFAARDVEVVIADAGSLPDAAAAEQLVRIADCVVLAVPLSKLRASALDTTARLLSGRSELILPVITHPGRSKFSGRSTPVPKATEQADDEELAGSRN